MSITLRNFVWQRLIAKALEEQKLGQPGTAELNPIPLPRVTVPAESGWEIMIVAVDAQLVPTVERAPVIAWNIGEDFTVPVLPWGTFRVPIERLFDHVGYRSPNGVIYGEGEHKDLIAFVKKCVSNAQAARDCPIPF